MSIPRIRLREWRPGELEPMHRWLSDPDVTRFLTWGAKSIDVSARHLDLCLAEQARPDRQRYYMAVELAETGEVIGDSGFEWVKEREGDLGYFLLPAYWRSGLGTECARLVLELAFAQRGASVMRASCDERNIGSERVMQKSGMRLDLQATQPGRRAYRITSEEWSALH